MDSDHKGTTHASHQQPQLMQSPRTRQCSQHSLSVVPNPHRLPPPPLQCSHQPENLLRPMARVDHGNSMQTWKTRLLVTEGLLPHSPAKHDSEAPLCHSHRLHVIYTRDPQFTPKHPLWQKTRKINGRLPPPLREHHPSCMEAKMGCLSIIPQHRRSIPQCSHRSPNPQYETTPPPPKDSQLHRQNALRKKNKIAI